METDDFQEEGIEAESDSDSAEDWDCSAEELHVPDLTGTLKKTYSLPAEVRHVSAAEYRLQDKDLQGINWSAISHKKDDIRRSRELAYENYRNLPYEVDEGFFQLQRESVEVSTDGEFFAFHSFRNEPSHSILHFQLRNLLWSTSAFQFFYLSNNQIVMYNSLSHDAKVGIAPLLDKSLSFQEMDLSGSDPTARAPNLGSVPIGTICVKHGLIAAGGFNGELVVQRLSAEPHTEFLCSKMMTSAESGITNGIEIFEDDCGAIKLVAANNDNLVRVFAAYDFSLLSAFHVPWAANWATPSPHGGKQLAVVGDDPTGLILDTASGQQIAELHGHLDYSFAAAWHPDGIYLATGNQDTSTRIWDMRKLDRSVYTMLGKMSAVRSLRYSPDGRFLAVAEAADYVSIYDVAAGYSRLQKIEFFSEIAGITFTPDGTSFMISLQDDNYGGFLQYSR